MNKGIVYPRYNAQLITLTVAILIVILFIYTRSFTDNVPSCNGYISNVYMYVLLGLLITCFTILFIAKRAFAVTFTKSLLFFAAALFALFLLSGLPAENVLAGHLLWLTFIVAIAVPLYVTWRYSEYRGVLESTVISTLLLTAGLVALVHWRPDWINAGWASITTIVLLAALLASTVPLILGHQMPMLHKVLAAVFTIVFCVFILIDTKQLREKAEKCVIPNYPLDSLGLFMDIVNLGVARSALSGK